ncbi:MAG: DMT family transporter [Hydrogenophaga sp.]|uniref:DMT family transporter n=1 Tax=Hydrogenophaga intermedia TaxID=65786 RepID=UPI00204497BD|nr:DMT family transporter [Hydrogenophaga intermedia]MCM3564948.1 DMT family transporter [Hydrogenophaga intermedia]
MNNAASDERRAAWRMAAGGALLGTLGVFLLESGSDAASAAWFRCAFGLLALTLWARVTARAPLWQLPPGALGRVVLAAGLVVLSWVVFFAAIQRLSVGLATVVFHVQPLCLMLAGAWWLGEPLPRARIAAVVLALLGLALATGLFGGGAAVSVVGVALCGVAVAGQTLVGLLLRARTPVPPLALAWWQCAVGSLVLWPWLLLGGWPAWGPAWGWLAALGIVHTGLAYVLIYGGMSRLTTSRSALLQFVYPAVTLLCDALVYERWLSPAQLLGVSLMALALWWGGRSSGTQPGGSLTPPAASAASRPSARAR